MLRVFYLVAAYVCKDFPEAYFKCFICPLFVCYNCLHLNVLKVDRANVVDLHLVDVDQISDGVSRLHSGQWRQADHTLQQWSAAA
jgi:hypothetical protein